ncbi:sensor histidine kinase [Octadecabacter sp. 1_MG-2023]|uniref:sensor histidine kinase n=1 Tax=unclassified Octadecabacter TaxID=196158 RepID=UPI001C08E6EB|nr:sensor histidine kinase [Octadecabacter sp. 1_MG-2023]MBU2994336.1 sensor histidine kinase [Octadecabacter sp. B2R22]MDO6734375.1 sensor histidine kinase [Octadecabacter sp. 1_MG-2023]
MSWVFLCVTLLAPPVAAQPAQGCRVAPLSNAVDFHIDLGQFACAFSDDSRTLTLQEILAGRDDVQFDPVLGGLVDFGFGSARYWVRVEMQNTSAEVGTWWVTHDIPMADQLRVTRIDDTDTRDLLTLTNQDPFSARPIAHRHLVSEIILEPLQTTTLMINYTSGQATEMPFVAETPAHFFQRSQTETIQIVALTALVLGMGLISTIYLYGLQGRSALVYGTYVVASAALLVHLESYTFQYIWPNAPGINQFALPIIASLSIALGTFFVDMFTKAAVHHPRLHVTAYVLIAMMAFLAALTPFLLSTIWFKLIFFAVAIGSTTMQVVLAIASVRRGQSGAIFLVLGFGALAAAISFGVLGYLTEGLFEQEVAGFAIRVGFLLEGLAFSAAIAQRVRATRRERDTALGAQLRMSEERLNLSEALRRAEVDRQRSADAAMRSQQALADTAHDIQQPLASLQMALSGDPDAHDHVAGSLQYLEEIVRAGLESNFVPLGTGNADPPSLNARERFSANIILKNIEVMFSPEAKGKGISLTVSDCASHIVADPLSLMRVLGNLVSNALQHGNPSRVVIGCRRRVDGLRFEVHDDGQGMSEVELKRLLQRDEKGTSSRGHGLGLSIISNLARENGFNFDISSRLGCGTIARVCVRNTTNTIASEAV